MIIISPRRPARLYTIFGLTGQVGMDRTDSLLDPTKGYRITTLIQPEGLLSGQFRPMRGRASTSAAITR